MYILRFLGTLTLLLLGLGTAPVSAASTKSPGPATGNGKEKPNILSDLADGIQDITGDIKEGILDVSEDISNHIHHSAFAGKITPILSKFLITPEKARKIWASVSKVAQWEDLLLIVLLGWATVPCVQFPYEKFVSPSSIGDTKRAVGKDDKKMKKRPFRKTYIFQVANLISQMAKVALLVYVFDVLGIVLNSIGFHIREMPRTTQVFAKIAYTLWFGWRVRIFKRYLIGKAIKRSPDKLGKALVFDRLGDALLMGIVAFLLVDILEVELGMAAKSLFAFGSVGTLVFSFASKDLASQIVTGLALSASDRMHEGEEIRFGDGTSGVIVKMGWMETVVRSPDELTVAIPNAQISNQRIVNVSRVKKCQVKQTLRFRYDDADKLPTIIEDIKREIRASCPALITDGSRPFRVHWREFKDDHLEVVVDCHFDLPPTGNVYWDNRQQVLQAIDRAVKNSKVSFASYAG